MGLDIAAIYLAVTSRYRMQVASGDKTFLIESALPH
jgi:hypothetical protein